LAILAKCQLLSVEVLEKLSKPGAGNASIVSARQQKLRSTVIEQIEKKQRKEEQDSLDDVEI